MKHLLILATLALLSAGRLLAQAQNQPRVVPTVADLLAIDPALYAASPPVTTTNFTAYVITTGDVAPGDGWRLWRLAPTSTAATNSLAADGPLATSWGSVAGRWFQVPINSPLLQSPTLAGVAEMITGSSLVATNASSELWVRTVRLTKSADEAGGDEPARMDFVNARFLAAVAGAQGAPVLDSMAQLVDMVATTTNRPKAVILTSYHGGTNNAGVGMGLWYLGPSYPTNRAVISAGGGLCYRPRFEGARIDIERFGARPGFTDDTAVQDAVRMQQDITYQEGRVVFVPDGEFGITSPMTNNYVTSTGSRVSNPRRLLIHGVSRNMEISGSPTTTRFLSGSTLRMMTDNTPIIMWSGTMNEACDLVFDHQNNQSIASGFTNGSAIMIPANAGSASKGLYQNLSLGLRSHRLLDAPLSDFTFHNNTLNHLYTRGSYGGSIRILRSGTINKGDNWYLQNSTFPVGFTHTAVVDTNVLPTLSGTNLTFTVRALPGNWSYGCTNGTFIEVSYPPFGGDQARFVTAVNYIGDGASNTVTVAVSSAEAAAIGSPAPPAMVVSGTNVTATTIYSNHVTESSGPMLWLGGNCQFVIGALNIELTTFPPTLGDMGGLIESSGELVISYLHMEGVKYTAPGQTAVRNFGGSLRVLNFTGLNISAPPGMAVTIFRNTGTTFGGGGPVNMGPLIVDSVRLRDFYYLANLQIAAAPVGGAPQVHINWNIPLVNRRVGGRGDWPIGTATRFTPVAW